MLPRLIISIIYALLPLASEETLGTTSLASIGAGMSAFAVLWETLGALEKGASAFESWSGRIDNFDTIVDIGSEH